MSLPSLVVRSSQTSLVHSVSPDCDDVHGVSYHSLNIYLQAGGLSLKHPTDEFWKEITTEWRQEIGKAKASFTKKNKKEKYLKKIKAEYERLNDGVCEQSENQMAAKFATKNRKFNGLAFDRPSAGKKAGDPPLGICCVCDETEVIMKDIMCIKCAIQVHGIQWKKYKKGESYCSWNDPIISG